MHLPVHNLGPIGSRKIFKDVPAFTNYERKLRMNLAYLMEFVRLNVILIVKSGMKNSRS